MKAVHPTTEILPPNNEFHRHMLARAGGAAALKQMKEFDSFSSLPGTDQQYVQELSWNDLDVGQFLGSGGFSSVYHVSILPERRRSSSNDKSDAASKHRSSLCHGTFALKCLNREMWYKDVHSFSMAVADLGLEAKLLSRLSHENIVKLHAMAGGCPSTTFDDQRGFFLVLGLLKETLRDRLKKWGHGQVKSTSVVRPWSFATERKRLVRRLKAAAIGIASGMAYLHENNIIYRDLKPCNVGFDEDDTVRIFDFGLAREIDMGERLTALAGTYRYMAPEVAIAGMTYGLSADVYSFGLLLWEICTLQKPPAKEFRTVGYVDGKVIRRGFRPSVTTLSSCPRKIKNLIMECLELDPHHRPTFKNIRARLEETLSAL